MSRLGLTPCLMEIEDLPQYSEMSDDEDSMELENRPEMVETEQEEDHYLRL